MLKTATLRNNSDMRSLSMPCKFDDDAGSAIMGWVEALGSQQSTISDKGSISESTVRQSTTTKEPDPHLNTIELAQLLLEYSPLLNVNVEFNGHRRSPLHRAVTWCNLDMMKLLISHGADTDNGMFENMTP